MAFRRKFSGRRRSFGRRGTSRSPKAMNNGWVASTDNFLVPVTLDVPSSTFFSDVAFAPLIEVADYGDHESLDSGLPSKQDRARVLKMVGDIGFIMAAGFDGGFATWHLSFYLARFGKEETDNALANGPGGGLLNYDPLSIGAEYLYRQQAIVEHKFALGQAIPSHTETGFGWPDMHGIRNYHFNKKMSLPLKTDEEFYLVAAGSFAQTSENEPLMAITYRLRFLITD